MQLYSMRNVDSGPSPQSTDTKTKLDEPTVHVHPYRPPTQAQQQPQSVFGGIMISSEVSVDVEEVNDKFPSPIPADEAPGVSQGHTRSHSNLKVLRQKSQRVGPQREREMGTPALEGQDIRAQGGGLGQTTASYEQAIELEDVSMVLGMGLSRVVVKKEEEEVTFVDELFARCIDTP